MKINEKIVDRLKWDDVAEIREIIGKYSWCGHKGSSSYAMTNVRQEDGGHTTLKMHQLLIRELFEPYPARFHIDHVDGDRLNNTLINLRVVTNQENSFNRIEAKGYIWHKRDKKWEARIQLNGHQQHLGCYSTESEARSAYLAAKQKYHIIKPHPLILKPQYAHLEYLRHPHTNLSLIIL